MLLGLTELDNVNFRWFWVRPRVVFAAAVRNRLVSELRSAGGWLDTRDYSKKAMAGSGTKYRTPIAKQLVSETPTFRFSALIVRLSQGY